MRTFFSNLSILLTGFALTIGHASASQSSLKCSADVWIKTEAEGNVFIKEVGGIVSRKIETDSLGRPQKEANVELVAGDFIASARLVEPSDVNKKVSLAIYVNRKNIKFAGPSVFTKAKKLSQFIDLPTSLNSYEKGSYRGFEVKEFSFTCEVVKL